MDTDARVRLVIGDLVIQTASLQAKIEELQKELDKYKPAEKPPEG